METMQNQMTMTFFSRSENEAFARNAVAAFALPLSPTVEEIGDIKTAVSEAVTNCIVHAYPKSGGEITVFCGYVGDELTVEVSDRGSGIEDVSLAMQPFYTTGAETERSGMGFTIMKTFTDGLSVRSEKGKGTTVTMKKKIGRSDAE
ncbi:MAG: anti-sigma F factor [Clostridia bacterium]|nr:anti-sigma F factor [Clostridia bacterium]